MAGIRNRIPDRVRLALLNAQGGQCALCTVKHPVDIHHIVPRHRGGDSELENLVLLCRNHHDLADSGLISPEILRYYKRLAPSGTVILSADPTIIYELTVDHIVRDLLARYDLTLMNLAHGLLSRLKRSADPRYRRLCLELIFAIVYASMHAKEPNVRHLERLERMAKSMADELGSEGHRYRQLITHYLGVIYHNIGKYSIAKVLFERAIATSGEIIPLSAELEADKGLASVSMTATEHLSGQSDRSLDHLRSIILGLPMQSSAFANTYCFAEIKLAEHMLVRNNYERAAEILEGASRTRSTGVLPMYRVILLKDLAKTYALLGDRDRGVRLFVKAMALAQAGGFSDQQRKIMHAAAELGIDVSELEVDA